MADKQQFTTTTMGKVRLCLRPNDASIKDIETGAREPVWREQDARLCNGLALHRMLRWSYGRIEVTEHWAITHAASGWLVCSPYRVPKHFVQARRLLLALANLPIDWDADGDAMRALPNATKAQIKATIDSFRFAGR